MSIKQFPGGIITKNPTAPTTSAAKGIWTLDQAQNYTKQGIWPRSPGAPTIGTATDAATGGAVSVTFSAPSCTGSNAITGYTATSTPSCITGTAASSPVIVSGLTNGTAYTFKVKATNGAGTGPESAASNSATPTLPVVGQDAYITPGSYSWVAPAGVTSISVVAVGSGGNTGSGICPNNGGGGGGGGLGYKNNYSVTPGSSYCVVVGALSTSSTNGRDSYFVSTAVVKGGGGRSQTSQGANAAGGTYTGDGGGNGGTGGIGGNCYGTWGGGGGAGGYAGNGGNGGNTGCNGGGAGSGGGAGGAYGGSGGYGGTPYGGGGVGILGQGTSGAASTGTSCATRFGKGGSGGTNGTGSGGGNYGGGNGLNRQSTGAVRIIYPGNTRSFPSTCTGNL